MTKIPTHVRILLTPSQGNDDDDRSADPATVLTSLPRMIRRHELQLIVPLADSTIFEMEKRVSFLHASTFHGEDWLPNCKPAFNSQASLVDAVVRWLNWHPDWLAPAGRMAMGPTPSALQKEAMLWIGPPPTHSNAPPPDELEQMIIIARKYDVAERDARNRALSRADKERVLAHERANLLAAGRTDFAERIRWVSHVDGDGAGYDIRSFDADGGDRLIEVKTTKGWERTPFHITRNELAVAEEQRSDWRLVRLWNFAGNRGFRAAATAPSSCVTDGDGLSRELLLTTKLSPPPTKR